MMFENKKYINYLKINILKYLLYKTKYQVKLTSFIEWRWLSGMKT